MQKPSTVVRAGDFRKRVTLQKPLYNSPRDEIIGYQTMGSAWASIEPGAGSRKHEGGRDISVEAFTICMRTSSGRGIDTTWQITRGTTTYQVLNVTDAASLGVALTLTCQAVR